MFGLLSNTGFTGFRATLVEGGPEGDAFTLPGDALDALGLRDGDPVRAVALYPADRHG